ALEGGGGPVDVLGVAAGQAADDRPLHLPSDGLDGLEIAGGGDWEAGLDHVHAEVLQRVGHLQLFAQVHAGPGRLLAVAQRGVEDDEAVVHQGIPFGNKKPREPPKVPGSVSATGSPGAPPTIPGPTPLAGGAKGPGSGWTSAA